MTVAELIAKLQQFDPDAPVLIECSDHAYSGEIADDAVEKSEARLRYPEPNRRGFVEGPPEWVVDEHDILAWPSDAVRTTVVTIRADGFPAPAKVIARALTDRVEGEDATS
jgi:hypothetical protein